VVPFAVLLLLAAAARTLLSTNGANADHPRSAR
jgi:hypothetical protein